MNKKTIISRTALVIGIIIAGIALHKIYLYVYVLQDASEYPSGVKNDIATYTINPETILTSLDQGKTDIFLPALKSPIYDDVPILWAPGSFPWGQEDYLKIANSLHQFVWKESLEDWYLYSADFGILQCRDISRIDSADFGFYQRQGNWYYIVHNMAIGLGYGYVYAGNDNGYYKGKWKDIDLDKVVVNSANKALQLAEQNGGQEARLAVKDDPECHISIFFAPFVLDQADWGWRVIYKRGTLFMYGIIIDPYSGKYEILDKNQ